MKYSTLFEAEIGAEAIYNIFKDVDLDKLLVKLEAESQDEGHLEKKN
jgi:hypothetical protein